MVLFRQLSTLLCAAVLVCILRPSDSQLGITLCPTTAAGCGGVVPNSECRGGACECKQGFYDDHGSDCLPKKGLGDACTKNDECQDFSHCDGGHCVGTANNTTVGTMIAGNTTVGTTTVGTTTVSTTTAVTTTAGTTTDGTADQNNPSNGAGTVISIGDRAVVIQGFLQYVMVNRN